MTQTMTVVWSLTRYRLLPAARVIADVMLVFTMCFAQMEIATLRIGLHGERKVKFEKLAQKAAEEAPDNIITFPIW